MHIIPSLALSLLHLSSLSYLVTVRTSPKISSLPLVSISEEQDMADANTASDSTTGTGRSYYAPPGWVSLGSVLLTVVLMIIIGWRFIDKAPPQQGPDIRLVLLSLSDFSASESQLRGRCHVGLKMSNPDEEMDMSLEELRVSILHRGAELARTTVQEQKPIPLERTAEKDVKVSMAMKEADSPKLPKKKVYAELEKEWTRRVVNFHVKMQVSVGFGAEDSPPKSKLFNLSCGQLRVFFFGKRKDTGRLVGVGRAKHYYCVIEITG